MRIIAGKHRARRLTPPKDEKTTRPITDRVKENLFNRLQSLGVLGYGRVADLFCGTGSLGLEALSRGAEHCTFVDMDRDAIDRLRQNLEMVGETDRATVVQGSALAGMWTLGMADDSLAMAFADPPYRMMHEQGSRAGILRLLAMLAPKLEPGGVLLLRTDRDASVAPIDTLDGPVTIAEGSMRLHFYQRELEEEETEPEQPGE